MLDNIPESLKSNKADADIKFVITGPAEGEPVFKPPQDAKSKRNRLQEALFLNECGKRCREKAKVPEEKPEDFSKWYWALKQQRYGFGPSASECHKKYRWEEQNLPCSTCPKTERKPIHPYLSTRGNALSGGMQRNIVGRWGKMWDSALSDLKLERSVFENNPDAEQTYASKKERIDDGCRKLWSIAKMNQNIITMMMKKFVSGPPNKLYTLNRIEAAQCWSRIVDDRGLVKQDCCVDLPSTPPRDKSNIPSLRLPKTLRKDPGTLARKTFPFRLPKREAINVQDRPVQEAGERKEKRRKRSSAYWLNPKLVPPVPAGFREEEFSIEPKFDPTGEIRRDLAKAKEIAKRYTRFASIVEKAVHVTPNLERINQIMDENFVSPDPAVRRQTLIRNFFSTQKIDNSPEYKRDAVYTTILSRNDNPKDAVVKKPFPYILAELSKSKSKTKAGLLS